MNPRAKDWSQQAQRLWDFIRVSPNREFSAPELNAVCAGEAGSYVSSFSKRAAECRQRARSLGWDFVKTKDEWVKKTRHTGYTLVVP